MITLQINSDDYTQADFFSDNSADIFSKARTFTSFLDDWKEKGTYSYHRNIRSPCANRVRIRDPGARKDREMIAMASNNYLGLNTRPEIVRAAQEAIAAYGTGMCGSRFLSGTYDLVVELERQLAEFEHFEAAMVFTTGYQANVGAISALMRPGDTVFMDRLCHASIVDGCRLAGCTVRPFRHNDTDHLASLLSRYAGKARGKLVAVDGIFSMDGDMAPLPQIVELARQHNARVMVDEAHATGVIGPGGRGTVEHFGLDDKVDVLAGTFSKTLASTGGFIVSSQEVVNYVRHYARSYIFSASPTPVTVATALAALDIVRNEPQLRDRLWDNVCYFHRGLKALGFQTYPDPPQSGIMTIVVGLDHIVRSMSKSIYEAGLFVGSAAYPAVPKNEGRFRFALSAEHTREDMNCALEIMNHVGQEYGIIRGVGMRKRPIRC
jgi:glycine C-acetyltransferase